VQNDPALLLAVQRLCALEPPDWKALEQLGPELGTAAMAPLLDGLAAAETRAMRRGFLSVLVRLGPRVAPLVGERLAHEAPWYVTRNLLTLLDELHQAPPTPVLERLTAHADPRVRIAALKIELKLPARRERAIRVALDDPDERVVRIGHAATHGGTSAGQRPTK